MLRLTLRNEGKAFQSGPFPHTPRERDVSGQPCRSLGTDAPSLWRPETMGIERTGAPLGNGSAESSHCCTFENFLTSRPGVKRIWTSPCLQPWHGIVSECLRSQDSTRPQWADYVKTSEDKAKWTSKDLGRPGIPFQKSASSVVAEIPILGSHFGFELQLRGQIKFFTVFTLWMKLIHPWLFLEKIFSFSWRRLPFWMPFRHLHYNIPFAFLNLSVCTFTHTVSPLRWKAGMGAGNLSTSLLLLLYRGLHVPWTLKRKYFPAIELGESRKKAHRI